MQFVSEFFSGNRQRLIEASKAELVIIAANGLLQRSADTTYPFRQDSNFWYLTGIEEPDFILVLMSDHAFLIAPPRPEHRDMWDGALDEKGMKELSGIKDIYEQHEGWNKLDRLIKKIKRVHTITPAEAYFSSFGFYANPARGSLLATLKKHRSLELVDVRKDIARMRQVKQPVELDAIQKAINITAETLRDIQKKLSSFKYEYEIAAEVTKGFIKRGASGHAYQPIIASGGHAATIHYIDTAGPIEEGQLILFDVGAEVHNYSADISRTYATGQPSKRQKEVHASVVRVQKEAYKLLGPGVIMKKYEQDVDDIMALELKKLGLLEDVNDHKKLKKFYPHLTSHFLGLDTHDSADYELPLEPGMVLTVEPGIYLPDEGIGVRVEDNVLVTKTGIRVLSASLPSSLL